MQVLELNRKILRLLGMCLERDATRREFYLSVFANMVIVVVMLFNFEIDTAFFYDNLEKNNNIGDAIHVLMQIVGTVQATGIYISFILNKKTIFDFFDELQKFVDESESILWI